MRACVQRVSRAAVTVDGQTVGRIGPGLVVLLGAGRDDRDPDARAMADKVVGLRIFPDDQGRMNRSVQDCRGEILAVSQFTLYGDARKGRRPSFVSAADPQPAQGLYELFVQHLRQHGVGVQTGRFQADMQVELVNDGPVTILLDSQRTF